MLSLKVSELLSQNLLVMFNLDIAFQTYLTKGESSEFFSFYAFQSFRCQFHKTAKILWPFH